MWVIIEFMKYLLLPSGFGVLFIIYWANYKAKYWKQHNMPHVPALPFIGNLKNLITFNKSVADNFYDYYFDVRVKDSAAFGINVFHKPTIVVRDPELIKNILVRDFNSFPDRYSSSDVHTDLLGSTNLFFLRNPSWRVMRTRLTPLFSISKLKQMFSLINDIGNELDSTLLSIKMNEKTNNVCTEFKDYVSRYATDVIASCAFGVQANCLQDPESDFRKNGRKIFQFNFRRRLELTSVFFMPEIVPIFKFKVFTKSASKFIQKTMSHVIAEREKSGLHRNDLIDTLITVRNDDRQKKIEKTDLAFEGDVIIAQAAVFFTAGFETTSTTLAFGIYEMAKHPQIQKRLRDEIKETLSKNNGELTYDSVMNMEYLNMVFMETLRLYPALPILDRRCVEMDGYSLEPFYKYKIPINMQIIIPTYAIHRDPQYFPNPDAFDPERFSDKNKQNIIPYTFIPFGVGPHNCIGERFGVLQTKIGFVNFLRNHFISPSARTPMIMKLDRHSLPLQLEGGFYANITRDPLLEVANGLNGIQYT